MNIKTVTVLGANGTMGKNVAGIFASFGQAKVYMVARSLQDAKNGKKAASLSVRAETIDHNLVPLTYDELDQCIPDSDLIFESVAENFATKKHVYDLMKQHIKPGTIIGTGTSGLSINELSECFNDEQKRHYLGIHMYNPPYSMSLCELIPSEHTDQAVLDSVKQYLSKVLLRDVVQVKDEPAFMGNRIGFQFINEALQYADQYKSRGGIDYIDAIFGGMSGRSMPPLVTSDFVGLDVHKAIVDNVYENTNDYEHSSFILPQFTKDLISENRLGRKTGEGLYRRVVDDDGKRRTEVYDIESGSYRCITKYDFSFIREMKHHLSNGRYSLAMGILLNDPSDEAQLCVQLLLKYILYSLYVTKSIGEDIHSADHVMATGFNWIPPLALLDAFGHTERFEDIVKRKLPQAFLDRMNLIDLLSGIEHSSYDYRPYFKAN